jgi:hypothetical protein
MESTSIMDTMKPDVVSGNNWNYNIIPGLEAVYGYNMVNISHYNISENKQKNFF